MDDLTLLDLHVLNEINQVRPELGRAPTEDELLELLPNDPGLLRSALARLLAHGMIVHSGEELGYDGTDPGPDLFKEMVRREYRDVQERLVAQLDRLRTLLDQTRKLWTSIPPLGTSDDLDPGCLLETLSAQFMSELCSAAESWRDAVAELPHSSFASCVALEETRRWIEHCKEIDLEYLAKPDEHPED